MAGGIATRYSLAERESMAAWDEWCMVKPLTAAEIRLSEELDRLASGRIPELWHRYGSQKIADRQKALRNEACRQWRVQHPDYDRSYKVRHREKILAQAKDRYRRKTAMEAEAAAEAESA